MMDPVASADLATAIRRSIQVTADPGFDQGEYHPQYGRVGFCPLVRVLHQQEEDPLGWLIENTDVLVDPQFDTTMILRMVFVTITPLPRAETFREWIESARARINHG